MIEIVRGIVICSNERAVHELEKALSRVEALVLGRTLAYYPDSSELERLLNSQAPALIFLDMEDPGQAAEIAAAVSRLAVGAQIVGITNEPSSAMLRLALRSGMRELLATPLDYDEFDAALERLFAIVRENPPLLSYNQHLFSFVPAKPGSGASTLALHAAAAMASRGEQRVALMDFDFDSGTIDFMLKLAFGHGIADAAEYAARMDETMWLRMTSRVGKLDVLRSGTPHPGNRVTAAQSRHLIDYARRNYNMVCLDLPGINDECSAEILQQSNQVFLVCTPEVASLHMARRRMEILRQMRLAERTSVIVNRCERNSPLNHAEIRKLIGADVFATMPNDYVAAQRAVMNGKLVDSKSPLGKCFGQLSDRIIAPEQAPVAPAKEKWIFGFKPFNRPLLQLGPAEPSKALVPWKPRSIAS